MISHDIKDHKFALVSFRGAPISKLTDIPITDISAMKAPILIPIPI